MLDFGLAKPTEAMFQGDLAESPTLTYAPTGVGVILGTAAYMSPEQVRGQEIDKRSDIWAFGVVLWEMLTGKKLFQGGTVSDVLASTLMREPDWAGLPPDLPPTITRVLRRCLVQDPKGRLHDIADARIELNEALEEPDELLQPVAAPTPVWLRVAPWLAAVLALTAGWFFRPVPEPEPLPTVRFEVTLPEGERLAHSFRHGIALSPDGESLAFVSGTASKPWRVDSAQIYIRRLADWDARPVPGAVSSAQPVFSPDGQWLAFVTYPPARLHKVSIDGGQAQTLCECDAAFGASWGYDDTIIFAGMEGGLQRISVVGGQPHALTELNEEAGELSHRLPHPLPDGSAVLFTVFAKNLWPIDWSPVSVQAHSVASGERRFLIEDASDARYVPTGHLVFAREGELLAVRFDVNRLVVSGPEVPVLKGVNHAVYAPNTGWYTAAAQFSFSYSGSLAYAEGSVFPEIPTSLALVDRQGQANLLPIDPRQYLSVRLAPDGKKLLLADGHPPADAWIFDLERRSLTRQTFDGQTVWAIWGPDPEMITFSSMRDGTETLYTKAVGIGPGGEVRLVGMPEVSGNISPAVWSRDGTALAFVIEPTEVGAGLNLDIWTISRQGDMKPFLQSQFREYFPEFSPDGRWLAYVSNESGRSEVYVRPFPGPGPSVQISTDRGYAPVWMQNGQEILFYSGNGFSSVDVDYGDDRLSVGRPRLLFEHKFSSSTPVRDYDVMPDGRFLLLFPTDDSTIADLVEEVFPRQILVVQNWLAELEEKLPVER